MFLYLLAQFGDNSTISLKVMDIFAQISSKWAATWSQVFELGGPPTHRFLEGNGVQVETFLDKEIEKAWDYMFSSFKSIDV